VCFSLKILRLTAELDPKVAWRIWLYSYYYESKNLGIHQ
jgi:hypothetical protein